MTSARDPTPWHTLDLDETLRRVESHPSGLSQAEAIARARRDGENALARTAPPGRLALLIRQFQSLLVAVLIVASAVSGLLGEWIDAVSILAIVLLNAGIGFFQEWRAETAIAALHRMTAPHATVRRTEGVTSIAASELVAGDIVLVEAGDLVPADLRWIEAASLRCVEATLTGESEAAEKTIRRLDVPDLPIGDRSNLGFMGTSIAAGTGVGVIVATGMRTELGRIARLISEASASARSATPLEGRLRELGRLLVWSCLGVVALLFALGLVRELPLLDLTLTSISLAVAAVPEGLPAVATVALALGVGRMAKRRALIRRLPAVETLGSTNVICTDKTGTLTAGQMTVRELWSDDTLLRVTGSGYAPEGRVLVGERPPTQLENRRARSLLEALVGCSDAHLVQEDDAWRVLGDPTEGALLTAGAKLGVHRDALERDTPRIGSWPFDSTRKRMSVARRQPSGRTRIDVKGALESILSICTQMETPDGVVPLQSEDRERILRRHDDMTGRALRVLAVGYREDAATSFSSAASEDVERGLVFLGLVGMYDPPRPGVREAVDRCHDAGVRVVMITGDHPATALAVARDLGIAQAPHQVMSGPELPALSDESLAGTAPTIRVFARVSASDKLRIVRAWQANGAVVAMTGDGVNDAPAVRGADIGIAMGGTGTEVTKQASAMIILDDDFTSIVAAVEEGRGIFDNIRKTIQYLLAGNSAELMIMGACIALGYPVPLLPIHLLWINLVTDGLPALCLATDPIDREVMKRAPRPGSESLADGRTLREILATALLTTVVTLAVYVHGLETLGERAARTHAFAVLVFIELLRAFTARSSTTPIWRMSFVENLRLTVVVGVSFSLQIAGHHLEPLRAFLKTSILPWSTCLALVAVGLIPVLLLELGKVWRAHGPHPKPPAREGVPLGPS